VAVKIRLKRLGKVRVPQYRIVIVDSRKKRDGKVIEEIGKYHPKEDPSYISVVSERAQYWLGVGAQPSEAVAKILKITGDWHKFKGMTEGAEGTLKTAAPKPDKLDLFNAALAEAHGTSSSDATTKKSAAKKPAKDEAKAESKAEDKKAAKTEDKDAAAEAQALTPADETPEGATAAAEEAEAAEKPAESSDSDS
jgi:small subunit ribosomal protein S16